MGSLPFGPPYPVSPIIRGARFAFLFAGIIYGRIKLTKYRYAEKKWREEHAKMKVIRDKEDAILRARIARDEQESITLFEQGKIGGETSESSKVDPQPPGRKRDKKIKAKPCMYDPNSPDALQVPEVIKPEPDEVESFPRGYNANLPKATPIPATMSESMEHISDLPKVLVVPEAKPEPSDGAHSPQHVPPPNPNVHDDAK